ncbi:MAG: p-hydroxybenzoic acid efflux pump subunit AaeB, partial [Enterobacter kobei]|nr:p-hydroxybenzoic acid efflux pump subunit AaeB [Enterobacter kobei]
AAVSSLTTNTARRKENHLPALYQQLFLLLSKFPDDVAKFRLALTLIIAHQRYFTQLLAELDVYQEKLRNWSAPDQVTHPVKRLVDMLHKYQHALTDS